MSITANGSLVSEDPQLEVMCSPDVCTFGSLGLAAMGADSGRCVGALLPGKELHPEKEAAFRDDGLTPHVHYLRIASCRRLQPFLDTLALPALYVQGYLGPSRLHRVCALLQAEIGSLCRLC